MSDDLVLVHYGTKGMKWGIRKKEDVTVDSSPKTTPTESPSTSTPKPLYKQKRVVIPVAIAAAGAYQVAKNPISRRIIVMAARYPIGKVKYKELAPPGTKALVEKYLMK